MELSTAISLLGKPQLTDREQRWADLGCGDGLFTKALASLLPDGSTIVAIDRDANAMEQIPAFFHGVTIETQAVDFSTLPFSPGLDGILMANSLHFKQDAKAFLEKLIPYLAPNGRLLIVEYDREDSNQWVPYPVSLNRMTDICNVLELQMTKLGQQSSQYGAEMYTVLLHR